MNILIGRVRLGPLPRSSLLTGRVTGQLCFLAHNSAKMRGTAAFQTEYWIQADTEK